MRDNHAFIRKMIKELHKKRTLANLDSHHLIHLRMLCWPYFWIQDDVCYKNCHTLQMLTERMTAETHKKRHEEADSNFRIENSGKIVLITKKFSQTGRVNLLL